MKGVPLDNTYSDTIYFANVTDQYNYFSTLTGNKVFNQQTYQRVNKGTLRLQVLADEIYDYNYLMFRNTSYGSKWFYAFINKVNYINDTTTEIEYELDVIQTWMFEAVLEPSYVEREHSSTDVIGEHLAFEPVKLGEYKCHNMARWGDAWGLDSYSVVVIHAPYNTGGNSGEPTNSSGDSSGDDSGNNSGDDAGGLLPTPIPDYDPEADD